MAPPLKGDDGLLRRTGLPDTPDSYYKGVTVSDIPVCGGDDEERRYRERLVVGTSGGSTYVDFPSAGSLNPNFRGTSIDDPLLRRILTAAGGFVYDYRGRNASGEEVSGGNRVLHLCREEPATAGGPNAIYISNNSVFGNQPSQPAALRPVIFEFRPEEVMAIIHGLRTEDGSAFRIPGDHFQVNPADHSQLSLMPNLKTLEAVIEGVQRKDSLIRPERREAMVKALEEFVDLEIRQSTAITWQLALGAVGAGLGLAGLGVAVWQVIKILRMNREMMQMQRDMLAAMHPTKKDRKDMTVEEAKEILKKYAAKDMLEEAAKGNKGTFAPFVDLKGEMRDIHQALASDQNVALRGKPGVGKSARAEGLALAIVDGEVKGWDRSNTFFYEFRLMDLIAGTKYRGEYEEKLADIFAAHKTLKDNGFHSLGWIDEMAQEGNDKDKEAGSGFWGAAKQDLGRQGGFITATTDYEWEKYIAPDPALERRFSVDEIGAATKEETVKILTDPKERAFLTEKFGDGRITLSDEAIKKVVELADLYIPKEAFPGKAIKVLRGIIGKARLDNPSGNLKLNASEVTDFFLKSKNWTSQDADLDLRLKKYVADTEADLLRQSQLRSVKEFLTAANIPEGEREGFTQRVMGNWNVVSETQKKIFTENDPGYREGSIPRLFLVTQAYQIDAASEATPAVPAASSSIPNSASATPAGFSSLPEIFTEKTFADQIRAYYPDLKDPKFEQLVGVAARLAQGRWTTAFEADPANPPLTIANGLVLPSEQYMEDALRGIAERLDPGKHAHALEFKLIVENGGGVAPGHIEDLPADLVETGRRASNEVAGTPEQRAEAEKEEAQEAGEGSAVSHAEKEKELLRALIDENPQFFPDSEKLLRLLEDTRLAEAKAAEEREPAKLEDLVDRYVVEMKIEKGQAETLKIAAQLIDTRMESARKEERERKEKEKKGH